MTHDSIPQDETPDIDTSFTKRYWLFVWHDESDRDRYEFPTPMGGFVNSFDTIGEAKNVSLLGEKWRLQSRANIYDSKNKKVTHFIVGDYGFWRSNE